jgi:hypothetical protein
MLDAGFVGSYPTTASTWYDVSGYNNSGSLINGPTFNSIGAIILDGIDDYVSIPYIGNTSNSFTFNTIMESNTMNSDINNRQTIFGLSQDGNPAYRIFDIEIWGNNGFGFRGNGGPNEGSDFISYNWTLGVDAKRFNMYTITLNSAGQSIYVNGTLRNTLSLTSTASFNSIVLGTRLGSNLWNGSCFNFSMYNRFLSQAEILQNYYQAPIVTNGLVFAVDAGNLVSYESGSTTTYSMTGSVTGSLINGTGYNINDGGSWVFDGIDDYIITSSSLLNITTSITLETWLKSTALANVVHGDGVNSKGISSDDNSGVYETLLAQTGGNNYPFFRMRIGSSTPTYFPTNIPINLNQIYHFVSTYDGNTIRIFINGIESGTGLSQTGTIEANTQGLTTGVRFQRGSDLFFTGNIFVNRIYNRALTQAEVIQNFNAQKSRFGF